MVPERQVCDGGGEGMLVAIGGAESRRLTGEHPEILGRFVYAAGGRGAELVVIPIASSLEATGERYRRLFLRLGARAAHVLHPRTREAASDPEAVQRIAGATGIFFTGGDQFRLAKRLAGTALEEAIHGAHRGGAVVGGTSAGASFLSAQMIAFGKSGSSPRHDMVTLARGLGLTTRFVIDQHFRERNRLGRLLTALVACPGAIGLGLDEDTAVFIDRDALEVVGEGSITVVDSAHARSLVPRNSDRHQPICMTDLALHVLVHGATFDSLRRTATPPVHAEQEVPP